MLLIKAQVFQFLMMMLFVSQSLFIRILLTGWEISKPASAVSLTTDHCVGSLSHEALK